MPHAPASTAPVLSATPRTKLLARCKVAGGILFGVVLVVGFLFAGFSILKDTTEAGAPMALGAFLFLGLALLIALGFEFVNGFHDTANAVATVIYTHSLPPVVAVIWSGVFNFLGVLVSTGAVAYGIVTLLPVELILEVGTRTGYAMIFALLLAAMIWNLGTWALGIPNSSSHTLIGSIMGVGLANQLMDGARASSGVDWSQAYRIGQALVFSPLLGFVAAAAALLALKALVRDRTLFTPPKGDAPPPWWVRGLLILTCTGVSFAHGGNDGQKGMGLIMLILIGVVPTAYALNRTMPESATPAFISAARQAEAVFAARAGGQPDMTPEAARTAIGTAMRDRTLDTPRVYAALHTLSRGIDQQVTSYGALRLVPAAATSNLRADMYVVGAALSRLDRDAVFTRDESRVLKTFQTGTEAGTRFIPTWVKIMVALALGLGTMVGWKRIVVTVGERIGKQHMTYGQGLSAEVVAATTILMAERLGLPVSTTHILSSGVAGAMTANRAGLQWETIRRIAMAWVLTLPAAILLAGGLYAVLRLVLT